MEQFAFTPANGFKDSTSFPNPTTESATREQFQRIPDQIKDYINSVVTKQGSEVVILKVTDGGLLQYSTNGSVWHDIAAGVTWNNLTVSGTPSSNTAESWDSLGEYVYHLDVTASGITETMIITNFVAPTELLKTIAPYVKTGDGKITLYFKSNSAVSSSIITLTAREA